MAQAYSDARRLPSRMAEHQPGASVMRLKQTIDKFKQVDAARADYPGEHLIVLGVGVLLLLAAGRSRSFLMRIAAGAAGGALIGRAASGTGGIAKLAGTTQAGGWAWPRR